MIRPSKTAETPLVSLVIPVYNAMPYLVETLDAIPEQGLDAAELEVILVNDGSDDGSERVLADYAQRHPNYHLLDQPNSGGPADPCNKGIAAVRGKYFFVLGADDVLTERALGDLVDYAEAEQSDIVLAKMAGLNGRHAPGSMFKRSLADAHLVEDKLFNSLTAIKLFRTELVSRSGAYNPTHLRVGSDQPFTLACYLVADKISVRADRDYVLIRKREDGKNVTASPRSAWDYAQLLTATVAVIAEGTEPGELRDGILRRPVRGALEKALHPRFLELDAQKQDAVVAEIQQSIGPFFTPAVAGHLGVLSRLKARLALGGDVDMLRRVVTWQRDGGQERLVHDEHGFRLDLPSELAVQIDESLLDEVEATGVVTLEELDVIAGRVRLVASARVRGSAALPESVALRVQNRASGDWSDLPGEDVQEVGRSGDTAVTFRAEVDSTRLGRGVWDLYIVHRYGTDELVNRLGRHRADSVGEAPQRLLDAAGRKDRGLAYGTKGFGNLSLDIGYTVNARSGPDVQVLSALRTECGDTLVLLAAQSPDSLRATAHAERSAEGPGTALELVTVADGTAVVALPRGLAPEQQRLRVTDAFGTVVLGIPEPLTVPGSGPAGSPSPAPVSGGPGTVRSLARRLGVRRGQR